MPDAYIFDQDGTLYPRNSELFRTLSHLTKSWIKRELKLDNDSLNHLYSDLPQKYPNPFDGFASLGLSIEAYHSNVFEQVDPSVFLKRDEKLIKIFDEIKHPKYVITFASRNYSRMLQTALGILDMVAETLLVSEILPATNKSILYRKIAENLALKHERISVIGDNYLTDIVPALENGFGAILVGNDSPQYNGARINYVYELVH